MIQVAQTFSPETLVLYVLDGLSRAPGPVRARVVVQGPGPGPRNVLLRHEGGTFLWTAPAKCVRFIADAKQLGLFL